LIPLHHLGAGSGVGVIAAIIEENTDCGSSGGLIGVGIVGISTRDIGTGLVAVGV
jgi:hypothetical protein